MYFTIAIPFLYSIDIWSLTPQAWVLGTRPVYTILTKPNYQTTVCTQAWGVKDQISILYV